METKKQIEIVRQEIADKLYALPLSECTEFELSVIDEKLKALSEKEFKNLLLSHAVGEYLDQL